MTSPSGEHISRYRALGEFDNLIRAAREARRELRQLREEEAKLNAQSLADDKKLAASKSDRAKAETDAANSVKKALADLTNSRQQAGKAGASSAKEFAHQFSATSDTEFRSTGRTRFDAIVRLMNKTFKDAGEKSGTDFVTGMSVKLAPLNRMLASLKLDPLNLDVGIDDAKQSMKAIEFELRKLANTTVEPEIRIESNRALTHLRDLQKMFKDEVAEDIIAESKRIQEELKKIDSLPSGRSFKFWALTSLSDMSRVFSEADRGIGVFTRLRRAMVAGAGGGGGGNNFIQSFVSGFDDFSEASSRLLQRLARVSGELYRMPGLIGVLVSAIPALVAGLAAIGGGALGLASALGSVAGVMAAVPGLAAALIGVVGGLGSTFGGLAETLKNAREAHQKELEAKEQSRLGTEKALTATQKYQLALRDMAPATRDVTEAIVDFSEKWAQSQKVIGENFFKEVADQTGRLNQLLPIAERYFGRSAAALGKVADQGIRMITSGPWKSDFAVIAENNATVIENMGGAGLALANVFRNIAVAAGPFTTWLTRGLREGAEAFADWASQARSNGTISAFLDETQESLQSLWQIFKNLGNVVNSFFQSTIDEGQRYLATLEDITGRWADVAEAQEAANSPLREWMVQIRPVLSALGALVRDLGRGIADLATNQSSIDQMIKLLDTLRTRVLPPILDLIQELNDSGIANTVAEAIGDMLQAIADFLDSGAAVALSVFVTVLANFFELVFNIASLPGISHVLGGIASGIAAIAAVSIVARFTGLFKLWDFFTWMARNRGNLSGAFADAARGVAGLPTTERQQNIPSTIPSTVANPDSGRGSGRILEEQARATERVGTASSRAAERVNIFSRALAGISSAGNAARGSLGNLVGLFGGPWGIALTAAAVGISLLAGSLAGQKQEAEDTKDAFLALKNAYGDLREGNTDAINSLADTDEKLRDVINQAEQYGISITDVAGATANQEQSLTRFNSQMDTQINSLKASRDAIIEYNRSQGLQTGEIGEGTKALDDAIAKAEGYKNQVNNTAEAQANQTRILEDAQSVTRTYTQRLAGLTQEQVENAVTAGKMDGQIRTLSNALDTMSSATATGAERSRALSDIINHQTGEMESANEATENWRTRILDLEDSVRANGKSLSTHTREGLRNRDALEAAAKATRELYLQDIAAGRPLDEVTKKHRERIKELREEARRLGLNKKETENLIETYGDVPDEVSTDIKSDSRGFQQVYADLMKLKVMQEALQSGKSMEDAQRAWNSESSKLYRPYSPTRPGGDGYGVRGYATGGPVWGAGTRTSDSIQAWLSNGEFVQPTDAVEYYGMPVMEALRKRKLDKDRIMEALPDDQAVGKFNSGGAAHADNCPSCSTGGHRFAKGGGYGITVPYVVNPRNTKVDQDWVNNIGGIGAGAGGGGWQWQMAVLRRAFPGLELISGYRPGSRTLSGNRSYHSMGRAVDLAPRRDVAQWIRSNYGARTKELITPFQDLNLHNGRPHRYTGAVWNQHNFSGGNAHNHWAFNQGGLVDLMNMMGMQNLAPSQNAPLPSTPRTLSPAASSVVNNSTDNTRTFGDVIINNPAPERAGDSVRDALYRTMLLY